MLLNQQLRDNICRKVLEWQWPQDWPSDGLERLKLARFETSKFIPYLVPFCNLVSGRPDLIRGDQIQINFKLCPKFINDGIKWIKALPMSSTERLFYGTIDLSHNRVRNVWTFCGEILCSHFSLLDPRNVDPLTALRQLCYALGSPLSVIAKREVGGKPGWVLGTPLDLMNNMYGV